jgi:hypothetical protein
MKEYREMIKVQMGDVVEISVNHRGQAWLGVVETVAAPNDALVEIGLNQTRKIIAALQVVESLLDPEQDDPREG